MSPCILAVEASSKDLLGFTGLQARGPRAQCGWQLCISSLYPRYSLISAYVCLH